MMTRDAGTGVLGSTSRWHLPRCVGACIPPQQTAAVPSCSFPASALRAAALTARLDGRRGGSGHSNVFIISFRSFHTCAETSTQRIKNAGAAASHHNACAPARAQQQLPDARRSVPRGCCLRPFELSAGRGSASSPAGCACCCRGRCLAAARDGESARCSWRYRAAARAKRSGTPSGRGCHATAAPRSLADACHRRVRLPFAAERLRGSSAAHHIIPSSYSAGSDDLHKTPASS